MHVWCMVTYVRERVIYTYIYIIPAWTVTTASLIPWVINTSIGGNSVFVFNLIDGNGGTNGEKEIEGILIVQSIRYKRYFNSR